MKIKQKSNLERKQNNDNEENVDCRFGNTGNDCDGAAVRGITERQQRMTSRQGQTQR